MNAERFKKILAMTQSDNDAEALSAIRKANAMLKSEGKTWENVLAFPVDPIFKNSRSFYSEPHPRDTSSDEFMDIFKKHWNL